MTFNIQSKQRDRIASYTKAGSVSNNTGGHVSGPSSDFSSAENNRKKKPYRARGCRGGASRKGRKKAPTNDANQDDYREAQENVDPTNGTSNQDYADKEKRSKNVQFAGGKGLSFRAEEKEVPNHSYTSQTRQASVRRQIPPAHQDVRYNPSDKGTRINIASEKYPYNNISFQEGSKHHIFIKTTIKNQSGCMTGTPNLPIPPISHDTKLFPEGSYITESSQEKPMYKMQTASSIPKVDGHSIGLILNSENMEQPRSQNGNVMNYGKCGLKRILPEMFEEQATLPSDFGGHGVPVRACSGSAKKVSRAREEDIDDGFSFFSVSPRSYLSGQRKAKSQRVF